MRPKHKILDIDDQDPDGLAKAQAVASATTVVLDGDLIAGGSWATGDTLARLITILSSGDDQLITFTVAGTDINGVAQTDVITGVNNNTATGAAYFKTVTSITTSAAADANVSIGFAGDAETPWVPLNHYNSDAATVSVESIVGTLDVTVQSTFSDIQNPDATVDWFPVTALSNVSADTRSPITDHAACVRTIVNSYTNGAAFNWNIHQNGFVK